MTLDSEDIEAIAAALARLLVPCLTGQSALLEVDESGPVPPPPAAGQMSEAEAIQAEARWIYDTQGFEAYKKFMQKKVKESRKPRLKRAA